MFEWFSNLWREVFVDSKEFEEDINSLTLYDTAREMIGQYDEYKGGKNNPKIVQMFKEVTGKEMPDSTPWCAVACGYTLLKAGYKPLSTMLARDYLKYGKVIPKSQRKKGDIVVFKRGKYEWQGHVGFYHKTITIGKIFKRNRIGVIGGNQRDSYRLSYYDEKDLLGVRRPTEQDRL